MNSLEDYKQQKTFQSLLLNDHLKLKFMGNINQMIPAKIS